MTAIPNYPVNASREQLIDEIDRLRAENLALQRVAPTALEVVRTAVEARSDLGLDASPRVHALRAAIDKHLAS